MGLLGSLRARRRDTAMGARVTPDDAVRRGDDGGRTGTGTADAPGVATSDATAIEPVAASALSNGSVPALDALAERIAVLERDNRLLLELWDRHRPAIERIDFDELSEEVDEDLLPPLDKADCDEALLDEDQRKWRRDGYVVKRGLLPDDLIDRYCALREHHPDRFGWLCPTPYMDVREIRDLSLYRPLTSLLARLVGEEVGLHLNLTGWISTDRNWHQDDYLNPPIVNSWYAAVWMALDDIHPDSGPFEFVPGSHRWPLLRKDRVSLFLPPHERGHEHWPMLAERFVNAAAQAEIDRRGVQTETFIARKGDVLVWHGRLMHRGSYARVPGMTRKALIAHYTGVSHRPNTIETERTADGSTYFVHHHPLGWDPYAAPAEPAAT